MRNLPVILNIILFIAVIVLYYLHFNDKSANISSPSGFIPVSDAGIVFVNSDSLVSEYEYYKKEKSAFQAKQERIKNELQSQGEKLQNEVEQYQRQAIGMTDMEKAQKEEQLAQKQQKILMRKEELLDELDADQGRSLEELYNKLSAYLSKMNTERKYNFVLGYQKGGGILFANDSLNITQEVLEGLNKEYSEQNK